MDKRIIAKLTARITNVMNEVPRGRLYLGQLLTVHDVTDETDLNISAWALLWCSKSKKSDMKSAREFLTFMHNHITSIVHAVELDVINAQREELCESIHALGFRVTRVKELNELGTVLVRVDNNQPVSETDLIKARFSAIHALEDKFSVNLIEHIVKVESFLNSAVPAWTNVIGIKRDNELVNVHVISPVTELVTYYDYYLELCNAEKSA